MFKKEGSGSIPWDQLPWQSREEWELLAWDQFVKEHGKVNAEPLLKEAYRRATEPNYKGSDQPPSIPPSPLPPVGEWVCRQAWDKAYQMTAADYPNSIDGCPTWARTSEITKDFTWYMIQAALTSLLGPDATELILNGKAFVLESAEIMAKVGKPNKDQEGGEQP